jgi:hypothetical protein
MIKLTPILFFLFLVSGLQAQKVKLKDYKVKAHHVNLPTIGFDADVTTFTCIVDGNEEALNRYGFTLGDFNSKIKIGGFNKVEAGGNATVTMSIGTPSASARQTLTVDKETKEKKKYKLYSYYFNLNVAGSYKVVDSKGNILSEHAMPKTDKISTPEYRSLTELNKYYKAKYPKAKTDALKKLLNACVSAIGQQINREYSMGQVTKNENFEGLKSDGHPDYKEFEKIKTVVEDAFGKLTAQSNEAFLVAIKPAIKFWTEKEPGYSPKDKQAKKLNFVCRYNAALAFFWSEDFDNAIKYASMIENGGEKTKTGRKLRERIEGVKEKMDKLNLSTRHFAIEVSEEDEARVLEHAEKLEEIYGSGDIRQYPEFINDLDVKLNSKIEPGKLFYKEGNVDEGYFVYESASFTPDFRVSKKIRFGKNSNSSIIKGNPIYAELDSMLIGAVMFRVKPVKIEAGIVSPTLNNAVVEEIQVFDKTRLEICHPPFKNARGLGDDELESSYVIWHMENNKHYSPDGLSFNKSMKKVVGECPKAMEYVDAMKAENKKKSFLDKLGGTAYTTEDLVEILRLYDECK